MEVRKGGGRKWEEEIGRVRGRERERFSLCLYLGLFALFSESLELTQFTANPCCILKTTYHIPPTDPIPLSFFPKHTGWASFDACPGKILKATLHFHHLRHILYLSRTTSASKCPSEPLLIISSSGFNPLYLPLTTSTKSHPLNGATASHHFLPHPIRPNRHHCSYIDSNLTN